MREYFYESTVFQLVVEFIWVESKLTSDRRWISILVFTLLISKIGLCLDKLRQQAHLLGFCVIGLLRFHIGRDAVLSWLVWNKYYKCAGGRHWGVVLCCS